MTTHNNNIIGLTSQEVIASREKFGANQLDYKHKNSFLQAIIGIAKEPMVILLAVAAIIYFISGKVGDAIFMSCAILFEVGISLFQDTRSRNALEKLKNFTKPSCKVIRGGEMIEIKTEDLVIGDCLVVEEGVSIAADGSIIQSNDFSVNESILTGESFAVFKDKEKEDKNVFGGTTVTSGLAVVVVSAIGNETKLGKIGKSIESIKEEKTPLEKEINGFVKGMMIIGGVIFLIVWGINLFHSRNLLDSLLKALTLAMSIMPEEIPVAFTTFMALGAFRLMKAGIVVKQMKTVETLGSATVICTDKTGTITENKMSLAKLFVLASDKTTGIEASLNEEEKNLINIAMWASEPLPFDPMEVALHDAYLKTIPKDERPNYKLVHEYPLSGKPPMMTHIFEDKFGKRIITCKGAVEALLQVTNLSEEEKKQIETATNALTIDGYRILGVGETTFEGNNYPATQQEFKFSFKGVVAFYDPPKKNIQQVLEHFYKAGIGVKIITGDNTATTTSIAKQIGFRGYENSITGEELMKLSTPELKKVVLKTQLFTRMFPEAKLKIIEALKAANEIVAMTGDGVNDGPALKAANIGIAMGKKGTEIAKQAASLILVNDDFSKMVDAVAMGRRIYTNLKKAIQYIVSIHIPIILTVFVPLALGWIYPNIFSPVHIIFLELVMGPTCSIIYENEPAEKDTMLQTPRSISKTFFSFKELATSLAQGLMITAGTLFTYQYAIYNGYDEPIVRTMVFIVLISANIFLTLVNRSFHYSILTTLRYKNNLVLLIIGITISITALLLYVQPLSHFFLFRQPTLAQLGIAVGIGFVSTIWYEGVKAYKLLFNTKQ